MQVPGAIPSIYTHYTSLSEELGAQPLPELLTALSSGLRSISISHPLQVLSDGQVIALCAVLPLSNLEEVTFRVLSLHTNSWVAIADTVTKCTRTLKRLTLKQCIFKDNQGAANIAKTLALADLVSLDISDCKLGDDFAMGLCEGRLLKGDRLTSLRLAGCSLGDEGALRIAREFENTGMMSGLKTLDLSYNRISDKGACALAAMLVAEGEQSSLPLNSLELEGNLITDVGCLALARAAKSALVLSRLNISLNHATDATLHAIADCLRFSSGTLKEVAVGGARAFENAAVAIIKAATRNNSLQLLDLRGVPLSTEGVSQLCQMLRYTATLQSLFVDVESVEGAEAIARELPNNRSLTHLKIGGPVPEQLTAQMNQTLAANTMRVPGTSPARSSPHIHAWIDAATLGQAVSGHTAAAAARDALRMQHSKLLPQQCSSPTQPASPNHARSPRSEAGSMFSHNTQTTSRTGRTGTSYLSFQFSQMSRKTGISSSPLHMSFSLAAGGAAEKAAVIFRKHDQNQDNYLNKDEMLAALQEVGVFNGIRAKRLGRMLDHEFKKADWDKDGKVSLQDFINYYERIAHYQTQMAREGRIKSATQKHIIPVGVENNPGLKRVFKNYCKFALGQGRVYSQGTVPHMTAQQFHRLCADAGFLEPDGRLSTTAVDVVFYRYRTARRLGFKEFVEALAAVSYEAGLQFDDLLVSLGCKGPPSLFTPDGSTHTSEAGTAPGGQRRTQDEVDTSFSNLLGLASIQEVPTPLSCNLPVTAAGRATAAAARAALAIPARLRPGEAAAAAAACKTKKKPLVNKVSAPASQHVPLPQGPSSMSNPLYESVDVRQPGAMRMEQFAGGKTMADSSAAGEPRSALEARLVDLEARLEAMAAAQTRQLQSSPSLQIVGGGPDGSVTASSIAGRLSKLEAQLSQALVKQESLEGVSRQMEGLQGILKQLAEEVARIKSTPAAAGADPALAKQVDSMSSLVYQLAGDVRAAAGRIDTLSSQLGAVEQISKQPTAQPAPGRTADLGNMASVVAALEKRFLDRQSRFEGALMQVARQVDVLDHRVKEEQDTSLRALETILASSQSQVRHTQA
ncbi:hypothetical protein V8C86DRAFT_2455938 [Haematococcus lacustris]